MIQILPAIDIIEGRCVRLTKGDYGSVKRYDASPVDAARRFADCGVRRIHLVDLEGAKAGASRNLATLEAIASAVQCELEWGGGIAAEQDLQRVFDSGASYAIVGSVAALQPDLFALWISRFGAKIILGADVRDGLIAVRGWMDDTSLTIDSLLRRFTQAEGNKLQEVIVTDIGRDGMLQGPSFALYESLISNFPDLSFTASGGVSSLEDIRALDSAGVPKVIVGKAIYENRISLKDIAECSQKESFPASM